MKKKNEPYIDGVKRLGYNHYEIRFRHTSEETGKQETVKRRFSGSIQDAYEELARLKHEVKSGAIQFKNMRVREAFDLMYARDCEYKKIRYSTYCTNKTDYFNHIDPYVGECIVSRVTSSDLDEMVSSWHESKFKSKSYSSATINRWIRLVKHMFNVFLKQDTPASDLVLIGGGNRMRGRSLDEEECKKIINFLMQDDTNFEIKHAHYRALIMMALCTGQRAGSLLALRWEDIDFEKRTISFKTSHYKGEIREGNKTGLCTQVLVLQELGYTEMPDLMDLLMEHRDIVADKSYRRCQISSELLVFPPREDLMRRGVSYMHTESVTKFLKKLSARLDLDVFTFHDLRRSTARCLHRAGFSKEDMMMLMGHTNWEQTRDYVRATPRDLGKVVSAALRMFCEQPASEGPASALPRGRRPSGGSHRPHRITIPRRSR